MAGLVQLILTDKELDRILDWFQVTRNTKHIGAKDEELAKSLWRLREDLSCAGKCFPRTGPWPVKK